MGRRIRPAGGIVVAVAISALILAPGASARHVQVHVNLKDQNGYRIAIEAARSAHRVFGIASGKVTGGSEPAPLRRLSKRHATQATRMTKAGVVGGIGGVGGSGTGGFLSVQVENRHAITTYAVEGTVTHNRLYGTFGDLGRISLHFHLHKTRTHGCFRGHERLGTFTGHVHFRGEDGYVDVGAHRVRGKVILPPSRSHLFSRCLVALPPGRSHHGSRPKRPERELYTLLYAEKHSPSGSAFFAALKEARKGSAFLAATFGQRGPVAIDREGYVQGKAADFRVNKRVTSARIHPSRKAFHGAARFKPRHHWKGSLALSFPGARTPLAGRGWRAELDRVDLDAILG